MIQRFVRWWSLAACALLLAACATPPRSVPAPGVQSWSGRMALTVQGRAGDSFSAGFELRLFNPLGGTVGVLAWSPGHATLRANGTTREFPSLDSLAEEVNGAPLPIASLFDWLAGKPTPVPGWEPDLSHVAEGRLSARRVDPPPVADLRLVFER